MTIVVGGYIVAFPLGGMTWHHLNYLLGLHELGHEVWFLEDSGDDAVPYNPATRTCDADPTYGIEYLETTLREHGLALRYCYYAQSRGEYYGLTRAELHDLLRRADLLLCVSGVTAVRPDRPRPRRAAVIDTDPAFTQLRMQDDTEFLDYYRQFDRAATFGRLIGTSECSIPTHGIDWVPTCQPVCLPHWPVVPAISRDFTTVGKWEHATDRHVEFEGRRYLSSKGVEWMKVIDLPRRASRWTMTIGMQTMPGDVRSRFESRGWRCIDPEPVTMSCHAFAQFIRASAGEFTVVKEIYRSLPSGWFSDRSSCYLASGRPVVTQPSGFERWLPVGEGLFGFRSVDEAAEALDRIAANYDRHSRSARRIAEEYLDSKKVLTRLLDQVM
ncbi:MAG TPA: glycosyltransferase [Methylomirabilota bacterium]|nr:glycosyltransferase [Methylomirabilota bacterium]